VFNIFIMVNIRSHLISLYHRHVCGHDSNTEAFCAADIGMEQRVCFLW